MADPGRRRLLSALALGLCLPRLASSAEGRPFRLLMLLWRGVTPAEEGFLGRIRSAGLELELTRVNAGQSREKLADTLWQLSGRLDEFDAAYTFGTTASVMARSIIRGRIPQFYAMVSNPVAAGLTQNEGALLTGSTDAIAASTRLRLARRIFPIRALGFLFNAREQNARVQLEELQSVVDEEGIKLEVLRVAPQGDSLRHQLERLQEGTLEIDALYLPSDSFIISQSEQIMAALAHTPLKVIAPVEPMVRDGALLAVAPDYRAMGAELADRLLALARGEPVPAEPVTVRKPRLLYNLATAKRLGVRVPVELSDRLEAI